MTLQDDIMKRLTTRNIMALATTAVFLFSVVYSLINSETVIAAIDQAPKGLVLGGGIIIGTFVAVVKDVYSFFFRKAQKKESSGS